MPKSSTLTQGVPSARVREEEVRRLEIAVDDAERVRLGDGLAGLEDVVDGVVDGERAALLEHGAARSLPSRYSITM